MRKKFVTLRVWHADCPFLEITDRHRDVAVESRAVCTHDGTVRVDAVMHAACSGTLESVLAEPAPADVNREIVHAGRGFAEVYAHYPVARSVHHATEDAGFLVVTPAVHVDGYEYWEVLTDDAGLDDGLARLRESADVRVERVADTPHDALRQGRVGRGVVESFAQGLTDRQFDILSRAVDGGYYDFPRGTGLKDLAADLGIAGPTALEHIRRAESRILPALVKEITRLRDRPRPPQRPT